MPLVPDLPELPDPPEPGLDADGDPFLAFTEWAAPEDASAFGDL